MECESGVPAMDGFPISAAKRAATSHLERLPLAQDAVRRVLSERHPSRRFGMFARVTTLQGPSDQVDEGIKSVQEQVIPAARQMKGFQGMLALADRNTGKMLGITLWESEDALRQSEEAA